MPSLTIRRRPLIFLLREQRDIRCAQAQDDRHVFLFALVVNEALDLTGAGEAERAHDIGFAHAVDRGFLAVDREADLRLVILDVPVDVHDARRRLHEIAHRRAIATSRA